MTDSVDEPTVTPRRDDAGRIPWETPVLTVLAAEEAENATGTGPDGGTFS